MPSSQKASVPTRRAEEFLALIASGDRATFRDYAQQTFSTDFLRSAPVDQHLAMFSRLHEWTQGFGWDSVRSSEADSVSVLVQAKLTRTWHTLTIGVDAGTTHIADISLAPAATPRAHLEALSVPDVPIRLEAFVSRLVEADLFSGAVLLAHEGVPVFERVCGLANRDFEVPNDTGTKFNLGSMNKMFTGVATLQLVERNALTLDDPLARFLPRYPTPEAANSIRIEHLLTHTAGLGNFFNETYWRSSKAQYRTVDDMLALAQNERLQFEPGQAWGYSNTGMLVLGKIIEAITGKSYYDYVREHIYEPADMRGAGCYELDRVNRNLAVGYDKVYTDEGDYYRNNLFMHVVRGGPHGGGYAALSDLLKFDRALRSGSLLSRETVDSLLSAKPELNAPDYGYGFRVDREFSVAGHAGGFPGVSSNLDMFLGTGWTSVVLSNCTQGAEPVVAKIRELLRATKVV